MLSWDAIIETLLEDDYLQKHGGNDEGAVAAHLVRMNYPSTMLIMLLTRIWAVNVRAVFQR